MCSKTEVSRISLENKKRIEWIDIVKFFGIFLIYLGHFGPAAGRAYEFVFSHHVALFFFISGCTENYNNDTNVCNYIRGKIKSLLLPFWCFAILSIILETIMKELSFVDIAELLMQMAKGAVRNSFVSGSLWFITCLFVMQIIFFCMKHILKKKWLIFVSCIFLSYFAQYGLGLFPFSGPRWPYNLDSAMHYIVYYMIGYIVFPYIMRLFELNTRKKKMIVLMTGIASFAYTSLMFFGKDLFEDFYSVPYVYFFTKIISVLIMIWFYYVVAKFFEDAHSIAMVGRNTLYLCGAEFLVRHICDQLTSLFGVSIQFNTPFTAYIYAGIMLYLANRYLVPIEKTIMFKAGNWFDKIELFKHSKKVYNNMIK